MKHRAHSNYIQRKAERDFSVYYYYYKRKRFQRDERCGQRSRVAVKERWHLSVKESWLPDVIPHKTTFRKFRYISFELGGHELGTTILYSTLCCADNLVSSRGLELFILFYWLLIYNLIKKTVMQQINKSVIISV